MSVSIVVYLDSRSPLQARHLFQGLAGQTLAPEVLVFHSPDLELPAWLPETWKRQALEASSPDKSAAIEAFTQGLSLASGDYIGFFQTSGIMHTQHLELAVAALERSGRDAVATQPDFVDQELLPVPEARLPDLVLSDWPGFCLGSRLLWPLESFVFRKSALSADTLAAISPSPSATDLLSWLSEHPPELIPVNTLSLPLKPFWLEQMPEFRQQQVQQLLQNYTPEQLTPAYALPTGTKNAYLSYQAVCQALRNQGLWQYLEAFQQKHLKTALGVRNVMWLVYEKVEPWLPMLNSLREQGVYPTVVIASERPALGGASYQVRYHQHQGLALIEISGIPEAERQPGLQHPPGLVQMVMELFHGLRPDRIHLTSLKLFSTWLPSALEHTNTPIYYSVADDSLLRFRQLLRLPEDTPKGMTRDWLEQQNELVENFLRRQAAALLVHDNESELQLREAGWEPGSYLRLSDGRELDKLYARLPVVPRVPVERSSLELFYESRSGVALAEPMRRDARRLKERGRALAYGADIEPFVRQMLDEKVWVQGALTDETQAELKKAEALPVHYGTPNQLTTRIQNYDLLYTPYQLETMRLPQLRRLLTGAVLALRKKGTWAMRLLNPSPISVAPENFWMSEKHLRPYPLPLVKRMLQHAGFELGHAEAESSGWEDYYLEAELRTHGLPQLNLPLATEALESYWDNHPPGVILGEHDRVLLMGPHIFKTWMMFRVQCEDMLAITTSLSELAKRQKRSTKFRFRHTSNPLKTLSLLKERFDVIILQALPENLSPLELAKFLQLCREHLKENGKLHIQTLTLDTTQPDNLFWQSLGHVRPYPELVPLLQEQGFALSFRDQRDQHLIYECTLAEPQKHHQAMPALPVSVKAVMKQAARVHPVESFSDLGRLTPRSQACILANDLLEQIPPEQLQPALARIVDALEPDGAFVLTFAPAQDWKWSDPKSFRPYPEALVDKLLQDAGLQKRSLTRHGQRWVWCGFRRQSYRLPADSRHRIRWEGDALNYHSLGVVNRELLKQLLPEPGYRVEIRNFSNPVYLPAPGDQDFALLQNAYRPLPGAVELTVRHHWPPDFSPPNSPGHWVMIQPWEFGALPERWIYNMNKFVDQVWVPSDYVRQCYLRSGLLAEKVSVVPNGVDTDVYTPDAPALVLPTKKRFKFLFVGGGILRKGVDLLLNAFVETFTADEDVALVIKEFGAGKVYRSIEIGEWIERYRKTHDSMPEIVHLTEDLPPDQMPALYNSCDALVHPFRGEGFALPIAEAMACERAVLVTGYGPTLEYCNDDNAYLLPAQEVPFKEKQIDEVLVTVDYPTWAEPDYEAIKALLRHIYENPDEAHQKGVKAREYVREHLTWKHSLLRLEEQIEELAQRPVYRFYREQMLSEVLGDAFAYVEAQQYKPAVAHFLKALQIDPYQPSVSYNLGVAYLMLGDYDAALESLTRSLREGEVTADLCYAMGTALRHLGDYPTSQEFFGKAQELDPNLFAV